MENSYGWLIEPDMRVRAYGDPNMEGEVLSVSLGLVDEALVRWDDNDITWVNPDDLEPVEGP